MINQKFVDFDGYDILCSAPVYNLRQYKVYGMINPVSLKLFYIGCSRVRMIDRVIIHFKQMPSFKDRRKDDIVDALFNLKMMPMIVIYSVHEDKEKAMAVEKGLICAMSHIDYDIDLTNRNASKSLAGDISTTYLPSISEKSNLYNHECILKSIVSNAKPKPKQ